jgi:hypothetical protein
MCIYIVGINESINSSGKGYLSHIGLKGIIAKTVRVVSVP